MSIAQTIDHAVLQPTQTSRDLEQACLLGLRRGWPPSAFSPTQSPWLRVSWPVHPSVVSAVVAFPHGASPTEVNAAEAAWVRRAVREVDMVVNLARALEGDFSYVADDIRSVVEIAGRYGATTKVILETGLLPGDDIKVRLCQISEQAGGAFCQDIDRVWPDQGNRRRLQETVASEADVKLLRKSCSSHIGVKASGGIRSYAQARRMIQAGASRLGTSATETIVREEQESRAVPQ